MSYKDSGKKLSFKPKYEQKSKPLIKFDYVFDQQKINFKTEIPELPAKIKSKPDQKSHQKKVEQIQKKIDSLKQQRKKLKQKQVKPKKNFDDQMAILKQNVDLAKRCIIVLKFDQQNISKSLNQVQQKIVRKTKLIKNLQRGPRQTKQDKKTYEQMNYEQLENQQIKLSTRLSLSNLSKKEETEVNNLIAKIGRIKLNAPHGQKPKDNTIQIQNAQDSLNKLKYVKEKLQRQEDEVKLKLQAIQDDIQDFGQQINSLVEQQRYQENEAQSDQRQQLKKQIYLLRQQVLKLQEDFETKKHAYEQQQAKIQWIKWATEIQNKKNQQWQAGRQERRRQKLRQKNKEKGGADEKQEKKVQDQGKPERPKINRNQKQIDNFTFLVSYCNGLISKNENGEIKKQVKQQSKDIQKVLKSGEWSKMKDVQVIKSKKATVDEQIIEKPKKKKIQKKEADVEPKSNNFVHNIFVQQLFDSAKIVPPTKPEEVQSIIKDLNSKIEYFLEHPQGGRDAGEGERQKYAAQKYVKAKNNPRQKKVVNNEDFPSLS